MLAAHTTARMIAPRLALASCMRGFLVRSTVGAHLSDRQRHNHFPATPTCNITCFVQGGARRLSNGEALPGPLVFGGPHTEPRSTVSDGPVQVFMLVFMPDALRAMTGVDPGLHVNRVSAAGEVLDAEWMAMLASVCAAPDDAARVQRVEDFVAVRWQALLRSGEWTAARTFGDWARALAVRAALSGLGRSLRQGERRVRAWAGLPLRTLHGLSRAERSLLGVLGLQAAGAERINWAEVAADGGYADQSHLCRESRRITGLAPQELLEAIREEESYWIYRAWQ